MGNFVDAWPRRRLLTLGVPALLLASGPAFGQHEHQHQPEQAAHVHSSAEPDSATELDRVLVLGRRSVLVGETISASEGVVGAQDMAGRPRLRTGDLLEFVPGLIATAHSGNGKANQYFLRGFNLDHGTDFATWVDGMPVNQRTHGHGQGYTDLNFMIPEAVAALSYRKGPYYADVGDFSSAGSARFTLLDTVESGLAALTVGQYGERRGVLMDARPLGAGTLLHAVELQGYDGPWDAIREDVRKGNLLLRYSADAGSGRAHATAMHYRNRWNSADQIPQRAVAQGLIGPFGSLDPTLGGDTARDSLSLGWRGGAFGGQFNASAYAIRSDLDLWSNFTYFLDDPEQGDQFQQVDSRTTTGASAVQQWTRGRHHLQLGAEGRHDDIDRVALRRTQARRVLSTVREDRVREGSLGIFAAHEYHWSDRLRTYAGLRHDTYRFDVDGALRENAGRASDGITSYKASLAWRPLDALELYASYGTGFHSNDARGVTTRLDPATGEDTTPADALVGSRGSELGARLQWSDAFNATFALWQLRLDSELLFVGDAGTTEASRASRRRGVEAGLYWHPGERWTAHLEAAYTRARFRDPDPAGARIPGSVPLVLAAGATARLGAGWSASAQLRHFGAYPLIEDDSVRSDGATLLNLRAGREWARWGVHLDVLNALDSRDHDIDYFYASRLPGEPDEGIDDLHFHVFARRSLRLTVQWRY